MTNSDESNATTTTVERIAQNQDLLELDFIRYDDEPDCGLADRRVKYFGEPEISSVAEIDNRIFPRGTATKFQGESCFSDTGWPLNMKMDDISSSEVQLRSQFSQQGFYLGCRLPGRIVEF
jgi:hypothetical protein